MFNNFFFKKQKSTYRYVKNKRYKYTYKDFFKYKKISANTPLNVFLNFKISAVVTPFYYEFFKLFWDFKRKKYKPKGITNIQYYFFFYIRDKKSELFYKHLNVWFYYFTTKMHKKLTIQLTKAFYNFYPLIKKEYPIKFVLKGKFKCKGNNKKRKWILKNSYMSFVKQRDLKKIVLNRNRTFHGAISSRTIF